MRFRFVRASRAALSTMVLVLGVVATLQLSPTVAADEARPATSDVPGARWPAIHSDGRVTFEVKAPRTAYDGAFTHPETFNRQVKLLWLGVGTAEQFRGGIKDAAQALQAAGIRVVYSESPGTAHEWQTWRRALNEFAPRLFQQVWIPAGPPAGAGVQTGILPV